LFDYYKTELQGGFVRLPINGEVASDKIKRFDSTRFPLFSDIFTGAGRSLDLGSKKGGLKA